MTKKNNDALEKFRSEHSSSILDKKQVAKATKEYPPIPSGSLELDKLIGGGWRRGYISEILGKPYGGKTTVALSAVKNVLDAGGTVLYIDDERAIDIGTEGDTLVADSQQESRNWLRKLGIDPFHEKLVIATPETGEDMYSMVLKAANARLFDLIVLDSIGSVVTKSELEGDVGEANIGAVARLNAKALKAIVKALKKHMFTHFMVINQIRDKIGFMQQGVKGTGGHALPFYARYRLQLSPMHKPKALGNSGEYVTKVRVQLLKCLFATGGTETHIVISSERGIDSAQEILDFAYEAGYAGKKGGWVCLYDRPVDFKALSKAGKEKDPDEGFVGQANGDANAKNLLQETGLYERLQKLAALNQTEDVNAEDEDDQG